MTENEPFDTEGKNEELLIEKSDDNSESRLAVLSALFIKTFVNTVVSSDPLTLFTFNFKSRQSIEEKKVLLIKQLAESGFDPLIFDSLLSNEINRRLKINFGVTFIVLTFLFTAASYAVIICNAIYKWNISQTSITALIIETPIQLIGILYIIARNLFPSADMGKSKSLSGK